MYAKSKSNKMCAKFSLFGHSAEGTRRKPLKSDAKSTSTGTKNMTSNRILSEENLQEESSNMSPSQALLPVTEIDSQNDLSQMDETCCGRIGGGYASGRREGHSSDLNYELLWAIGLDADLGFLNLSDPRRDDICFVSGENLVLFNLATEDYRILPGHAYPVTSLTRDAAGQHLMTSSSREIILWDSYLAKPILALSPDTHSSLRPIRPSIFIRAAISKDVQFVWAINTRQFFVWTIALIGRHVQANFVHALVRPIADKLVDVLVDPDDDNNCSVISIYEVHFFRIQQSTGDQELVQYVSEYRARNPGQFTCAAHLKGSGTLFIGTRDGYITEWTGSGMRQSAGDVGASSYGKQFERKVKLPYARESKRQVSVTAMLCTDRLVIVGSSHGEITLLTSRLQLLFWVKEFGLSVIRTLRMRSTTSEDSRRPSEGYRCCSTENQPSKDSTTTVRIETRAKIAAGLAKVMEDSTSSLASSESDSLGDSTSDSKESNSLGGSDVESSESKRAVEKFKLSMFREPVPAHGSEPVPAHGSEPVPAHDSAVTDLQQLPVQDVLVLGDGGKLIQIAFTDALYWTILEPNMCGISHITFHPKKELLYVLYDRNTVEVIDYKRHRRLRRKRINTSPDVGIEQKESKPREILCKLFTERKAPSEKQEEVTCLQCVVLLGFTLLLCGLENGSICILDGDLTTLARQSSDAPVHSATSMSEAATVTSAPKQKLRRPITSILYNEANAMLAAVHDNGTISLLDMIELTELRMIEHYTAHTQITDVLMDDARSTEVTVISIGTDRMCHIRHVTKTLDNTGTVVYESCARILRIEQFAQPLFIRSFPRSAFTADLLNVSRPPPSEDLYLTGNSEYKYRFYVKASMSCVKTVQSPLLRSPVDELRPMRGLNAVIIATQTEIGIQELPLTPLTTGYVYFTLPKLTDRFQLINNTGFLITVGKRREGENDSLLLWKIATDSLRSVGRNFESKQKLVPYYEMIPGGCHGDELAKIKEIFVYFTIHGACHKFISKETCFLHSQDIGVHTTIALCDVPFVLSALGFFPSEFELKNLSAEIELMGLDELDFKHFLVLYLNHRPVRDISYEEVLGALEYFAEEDLSSFSGCTATTDTEYKAESRSATIPCNSTQSSDSTSSRPADSSKRRISTGGKPSSRIAGNADWRHMSGKSETRNMSEHLSGKSAQPSPSAAKFPCLFRPARDANPQLTKSALMDVLKRWSEVAWSDAQAEECVGDLFGGEQSLGVAEVASRLVPPRSVIRLDGEDSIRVYA